MAPRCPLVLAVLARGPRRAHEVARAIGGDHPAARVTLGRLEAAGLVRRRALAGGPDYLLTARGRLELRLQRRLWALVAAGAAGAAAKPSAHGHAAPAQRRGARAGARGAPARAGAPRGRR